MPLVTTRASVAYGAGFGKVLGGAGGAADLGAMFPIGVVDLSGSAANISFTSIPATYKNLQLRFTGRLTSGSQGCRITFNGDGTAGNYASHALEGDPATPSVYSYGGANGFMYFNQSGSAASVFSASIVDILDYANTNKYKTIRSLYGQDTNSVGGITLYSGLWKNTDAITSFTLTPNNSAFWATYTKVFVYGIKGE